MIKKRLTYLAPLFPLMLAGCVHKPLFMPETPLEKVKIVFDWTLAPEANPEGMELMAYPESGKPWMFQLPPAGGVIELPQGNYKIISLNNDTESVLFRNRNDFFSFEAYTRQTSLSSGITSTGRQTEPPHIFRGEEENVVINPDMMWTASAEFSIGSGQTTLTLSPRVSTARYSFSITDVDGAAGVRSLGAAVSGLAPSLLLHTSTPQGSPSALPSSAYIDNTGRSVSGSFLTFGIPGEPERGNVLAIFIILRDGKQHMFNFDVTDQIRNAPDPMNVDIVLSGLQIPAPDNEGDAPSQGGIGVGVDGWEVTDIELKPYSPR